MIESKESKKLNAFIDNSVRFQDDFFAFVNGKWLEETEIPEDKARWGNFTILNEKSIADVKNLLESSEFNDNDFKKIKQFYEEGMNIDKRNKTDYKPLVPYLEKINSITTKKDLFNVLNFFVKNNFSSVIYPFSDIDKKNPRIEVLYLYSSGLSLPNKDYYSTDDKKEIRTKFVDYIATLFSFIGLSEPNLKAQKVLEFESILADKHYTPVQKRDPELSYNPMDLVELNKIVNDFNWGTYFKQFTETNINKIIIDNPKFFQLINDLFSAFNVNDWKIYLTAKLLSGEAPYLSERFIEAHFNFYGKVLNGTKKLEVMYKQVLSVINNRYVLGELVGKYYVQKFFSPIAKSKMVDLVKNLLEVMGQRIQTLDWMSAKTKDKALKKLQHFKFKVGYPDVWEDYSKLSFSKDDSYFDVVSKSVNYIRSISFSYLYKAPNPHRWGMSPQTINAYYSSNRNEIVFPAGILQFPFFDEHMSDAENYGGIGTVIGHEITHGFDDQGSKFDFDGSMTNWWSELDAKLFTEKGNYIVDQYEQFLVNGKPLNGRLTLGENIADHGGIKIAYQALQLNYKKKQIREDDDNLKSEEKFFYSFARIWRTKQRPEVEETLRMSDPHSHPKARVNITLANINEFQQLFGLKEGDKLYRKNIPPIW